jgi:hypothetical protein
MKPFLVLFFIAFGIVEMACSQNILAIDKVRGTKRFRFHENSTIKFKTINGKKISGKITYIGDSVFAVNGWEYPLGQVGTVYRPRKFCQFMSYLSMAPLVSVLPANIISNALNDRKVISSDTYIIAGSSVVSWGFFTLFSEKKMPIGKKYSIGIIQF